MIIEGSLVLDQYETHYMERGHSPRTVSFRWTPALGEDGIETIAIHHPQLTETVFSSHLVFQGEDALSAQRNHWERGVLFVCFSVHLDVLTT